LCWRGPARVGLGGAEKYPARSGAAAGDRAADQPGAGQPGQASAGAREAAAHRSFLAGEFGGISRPGILDSSQTRRTGDEAPRPCMSIGSLKVATYNIHRCVGIDGRYDPARIARVLKEIGADIVGLQEVDTSLFYEPVTPSIPVQERRRRANDHSST